MESVQYSFNGLNKTGTIPQKAKASVKVAVGQLEQSTKSTKGPLVLGSDAESDDMPRTVYVDVSGDSPAKKKKRGGRRY